jgi:hypothetical protein
MAARSTRNTNGNKASGFTAASTSASASVSTSCITEPTSAQFIHGDINVPDLGELTDCDFLGLEELVGDDLAPFAHLQLSLEQPLVQPLVQPPQRQLHLQQRKKNRERPKGNKNKRRKKWSGEQLHEETVAGGGSFSKLLQHKEYEEERRI